MNIEEKKEKLKADYNKFMRDGKPGKAHHAWKELNSLKSETPENPNKESKEESKEPQEKELEDAEERYHFEVINGVGEELARELAERFDSMEELAQAEPEDLEP